MVGNGTAGRRNSLDIVTKYGSGVEMKTAKGNETEAPGVSSLLSAAKRVGVGAHRECETFVIIDSRGGFYRDKYRVYGVACYYIPSRADRLACVY